MFALAAPAFSLRAESGFEWPDSTRYWRVIVDANDAIETYLNKHPQYFSNDKLVLDFQVFNVPVGGEEEAKHRYEHVRKMMQSRGMEVGTYISGTTVQPDAERHRYPPSLIAIEQMPPEARYTGSWPGMPTRKIVNVADTATRHALQSNIKQVWEMTPAPIRYVDNIPAVKAAPWEASCKHMQELGEIAQSLGGARVVFNIPILVGDLSDHEAQQLTRALAGENGMTLEMPWPFRGRRELLEPKMRGLAGGNVAPEDREAVDRSVKRYRQLLDSGAAIIMIPTKRGPQEQNLDVEIAQWVRTWKKPTDHLYISVPFFRPPDPAIVMI